MYWDDGNFELQIGPRAFVRGGANTELGLESLEPNYMQLEVTGGYAVLDLKQLARGQTFEVDRPAAAFHRRSTRLLPDRRRREHERVPSGLLETRELGGRRPTSPKGSHLGRPRCIFH